MAQGIYKIQYKEHIYIGSSANIEKRWKTHKSMIRNGNHYNLLMNNIAKKHGLSAFTFSIIKRVFKKANLFKTEQHYIDLLNPKLNGTQKVGKISTDPCIALKQSKTCFNKTGLKKGSTINGYELINILFKKQGNLKGRKHEFKCIYCNHRFYDTVSRIRTKKGNHTCCQSKTTKNYNEHTKSLYNKITQDCNEKQWHKSIEFFVKDFPVAKTKSIKCRKKNKSQPFNKTNILFFRLCQHSMVKNKYNILVKKYTGTTYCSNVNKFRAQIKLNNKNYKVPGYYNKEIDAAIARDKYIISNNWQSKRALQVL